MRDLLETLGLIDPDEPTSVALHDGLTTLTLAATAYLFVVLAGIA